tara:strand:- start:2862 stop:3569 length:708 start_codon:yes stop_codon:yes gene_type:complete
MSGSRHGNQFYFLGAALLVLAALYPILGWGQMGLIAWTVTFWVMLLAAIHAASLGPRVRLVSRGLGATAVMAGVAGLLCHEFLKGTHGWVFAAVDALTLTFLIFATGAVLFEVLRTARVSVDHLVGAASAYVMLGMMFTYAFLLLQALVGAPVLLGEGELCAGLDAALDAQLADYLYYSFVTLTTLGLGDLTPGTLGARVLTGVEAVTGQLFLTVLIARLIGIHVVHAAQRSMDE